MPDLEITVGGRNFTVSCQPGEEHFLRGAAAMLDAEAAPLVAQMGRLPESRMLLMAGLMLADKTAGLEDQLRAMEERAELAERVASQPRLGRDHTAAASTAVPPAVVESLSRIASHVEKLADQLDA